MKKSSVLRIILPVAYKNHPALFLGVNIWGIAQALANAIHMIGLANLIDGIVAVIGRQSDLRELGKTIVWYGMALLFLQCANSIFNFLLDQYLDSCQGGFFAKFHQAVAKMEPIEFEDEEALNHLTKLKEGVSSSGIFTLYLFGVVDLVLPYFIFTGTYFAFVDKKLILCVLFAFIPACFSLFAQLKLYSKLQDTVAPIQRRYQNYKEYLVDKKFLKETRSLGAFRFFEDKALHELKKLVQERVLCSGKSQKISMSVNTVTVIGYAAMLIMLVYSILNGDISVGLFVAAYSSMETFFSLMQNLIGGFGYGLTRVYAPVKDLAIFLDQKIPVKEKGFYCAEKGIQAENVTFCYPNTAVPAISVVNLDIPKGQILAVVGENGSGKSTLAKLLMGIYKPQEGSVRVGGNDTERTEPQTYMKHLSAVFQDFGRYKLTLDENVKISQLEKDEDTGSVLKGTSLDNGLVSGKEQVVLSRDFDGIELSGGQWQQVAIARARYRNHDVIVLDEPTAAIDPMKEAEIYEQFIQMSKGKTTIIITHRLGSARLADRILVLKEGRIIQDGKHEELVQQEGEYSRMWKLQAQNYVRQDKTTGG